MIVAIVVEISTVDLTSFWFACGALVALLISIFLPNGIGIYIQIAAFIIVTIITILFVRPVFKKKFDSPVIATNIDSMIGKVVVVESEIKPNFPGSIKAEGIEWTAKCFENEFEPGDFVRITKVEGNTLFIEKYEKEEEMN